MNVTDPTAPYTPLTEAFAEAHQARLAEIAEKTGMSIEKVTKALTAISAEADAAARKLAPLQGKRHPDDKPPSFRSLKRAAVRDGLDLREAAAARPPGVQQAPPGHRPRPHRAGMGRLPLQGAPRGAGGRPDGNGGPLVSPQAPQKHDPDGMIAVVAVIAVIR